MTASPINEKEEEEEEEDHLSVKSIGKLLRMHLKCCRTRKRERERERVRHSTLIFSTENTY